MHTVSLTRYLLLCVLLSGSFLNQALAQTGDEDQDGDSDTQSTSDPVEDSDADRRVRRLGDVSRDEYQLDLSIPVAPAQSPAGGMEYDLPDPAQNERLQALLSKLAARPGNSAALAELDDLLTTALVEAIAHTEAWRFEEATRLLGVVRNVNPRKQGLDSAYQRLGQLQEIEKWLESARSAREQDSLIEPHDASALYYYRKVLESDPAQAEARAGLLVVQQSVVGYAIDAASKLDFDTAEAWLEEASGIREPQDLVEEARVKVAQYHAQQAQAIEQDILAAIQAGNFEYAEFTMLGLIALGDNEDRVVMLRERLEREKVYGQYRPGQVIQDRISSSGGMAPRVVVVAAGSYLMGSQVKQRGRSDNEGPQHRVTIGRGFGLGLQEVTVDQFRAFIEAGGYQTEAERDGRSTIWDEQAGRLTERERVNWRHDYEGNRAQGDLPVLHVSWNDAQAYVRWLSEATGEPYRLPTEPEFEYALRAGSTTLYWWGDSRPRELVENLTGEGDVSASDRSWSTFFRAYDDGYWGPAPGASFLPNPWGLHDMASNVSEWVMDCWHETYVRAPVDGSAWDNPGCTRRVVRGGYWASSPVQARSTSRLSASAGYHGPTAGFRIARDL